MNTIRLKWNVIFLPTGCGLDRVVHSAETPLGTIEINVYNNPDSMNVHVYNSSPAFKSFILDGITKIASRSDATIGHIKQLIQCLFENFILDKLCVD